MNPRFIDTHTHVNFHSYKDDTDEVIRRVLDEGVWMINAGTQFETPRKAVELAEQYSDGVYAAVALHPIHLFEHHVDEEETSFNAKGEEFDSESYKDLVTRSTKVVGIGEFGLDYFHMPEGEDPDIVKQKQKEIMLKHLALAKAMDKPVMIHCRDAYGKLAEVLKKNYDGPGEIHCFTGQWPEAKPFLEMGFYIALNGIITFDKTGRSEEVVKNLPLEQTILETDAPYLTPAPHRGKRNEPSYVKFVAEKIAEWKGIDVDQVAETTTKNARALYRI
jgi:TatD DNase family protein